MNIYATDLFPYLSGDMLPAKGVTMTIGLLKMEMISNGRDNDEKPVIYFRERPKGWILNKTNAAELAARMGPETDNWIGAKVTLVPRHMTVAKVERVAIRISSITPAAEVEPKEGEKYTVDDANADLF